MPNKFADSHPGQSLCLQFEYAHHLNARELNGYCFFFNGDCLWRLFYAFSPFID